MNDKANRLARFAVLPALLLLLGLLSALPRAVAQSDTPTPTFTPTPTATATERPPAGPLTITAVQPALLVNDKNVEIIVTGSGFVDGSVVVLSNFGGLETLFVSDSVLRAIVIAGAPTGRYDVRVVNPDAATAELPNALTIVEPLGPTATGEPTNTPAPTAFIRPLLVVQSYGASSALITPGQNLDFEMTIVNAGQATATNILATFASGDFIPRDTGGVRALGSLAPGQSSRFWQPLFATADLRGKTTAVLKVTVTYTDAGGQSYESPFELTFPVVPMPSGEGVATATPTPTATPTAGPRPRPKLLVTTYSTDPNKLEPGVQFTLAVTVQNQGDADARGVTLIVGGGTAGSGESGGTPEPGGLSGASGQFSEFAPIGSSNVSALGDLAVGQSREATQQLIVNTTTKPGAYPVKLSFVYTDATGTNYVDDQVITLLVYQQPQVQMNFYTDPPTLFAGEGGSLPLQLVNVGRNAAIFGNFSVNAENAQLFNNSIFVGALEPGGFFPLDAQITPFEPGPLELLLSVGYTDDFGQAAVITDTLTVEVLESVPVEPLEPGSEGGEGVPPPEEGATTEESLGRRIWRLLLGLLGLGSAPRSEQPEGGIPPGDFGFEESPGSGLPVGP